MYPYSGLAAYCRLNIGRMMSAHMFWSNISAMYINKSKLGVKIIYSISLEEKGSRMTPFLNPHLAIVITFVTYYLSTVCDPLSQYCMPGPLC